MPMIFDEVVMIIIGYSIAIGWVLTIEGIPAQLATTFLAVTERKYVFLTIILVLILGCVIENAPLKLMLVPMLLPIVDQYGGDRVHFGLVFALTVLMGYATHGVRPLHPNEFERGPV